MSLAGAVARGVVSYAIDRVAKVAQQTIATRRRQVLADHAGRVVRDLPDDQKHALRFVSIVLKARPGDEDLRRGATPTHRAYFYGVAPEPTTGTELPDHTPARGRLVLFSETLRTTYELERALRHEIAHITGHSEEEICEQMGLGT